MSELIFRVQDHEGRAPWHPGFSKKWMQPRPDLKKLLPYYVEFGWVNRLVRPGMFPGCGCQTIEQLQRWFTPTEYKTLEGYGYTCVQMEVHRIIRASQIQCVFERRQPLNQNFLPVFLYL
jgi:hypothetical protein